MAYEDCIDEIKRAAGRDLSDDELSYLLTELQRSQRALRSAAKTDDLDAAVRSAADDYAQAMAEDAVLRKRNAALELREFFEMVDYVRNNFRGLEGIGIKALQTGSNRAAFGSRQSAAAEQTMLKHKYLSGLQTDLELAGVLDAYVSRTFDIQIYRALWAKGREADVPVDVPREAVQIADIIAKWQELARQEANEAGAWIKKMPGYIFRQSHDAYKMLKAGYEAWRDNILPKLDMDRTFEGVDPEKSLQATYKLLSDGEHLRTRDQEPSGFKGPANLAKRVSAQRELHFKSADDFYNYNRDFGTADLPEAVNRGLEWHAQTTGLMRKFGPNPTANFNRVVDELVKGGAKISKNELHDAKLRMAELDGTTHIAVNNMPAQIFSGWRAIQNMAKLGSTLFAQFGDIPVFGSDMRYQGDTMLSGMGKAVGALMQGRSSHEKAEIGGMLGVISERVSAGMSARFSLGDDAVPGAISSLQQLFFKLNLMRWWTDKLNDGAAFANSHRLALNRGRTFDQVGPDLQRTLNLYGIDNARWDVIRQAATKEADGRQYVVPDTILNLPDEVVAGLVAAQNRPLTPARAKAMKREIADQLRNYYVDRGGYAVLRPDQETRAMMLRGTQPGTVEGEIARFVGHFKSFGVAMVQKPLGREVYGRGSDTLREALRNGNGELLGVANLVVYGALFGYAAMTAKDLVKGRTPRDPLSPKTLFAALAQGGGAGIYGDFLFGEVKNRFGHGVISTLAGPTAGTVQDIVDLYGRVREGDDVAAASFRTLLSNTPFMNLFYTRIVMDYLVLFQMQEALNPGALRRMERRVEKENAQTFLIRPSEWVR